ncbi:ras-specific guanine nucleotide-releasing factor 1 isoform X1 [Peromyscus californicus insignis]|uniref:ras-specific guanine nucleotide-releasing factor 1 isoform X1 n=1 Tax=Peromyscus californicus insignis TaxID=564181 RepID=UPI0022A78972|nr:ras-specific guanine nucleotide-releasing factor 1 isoform X1 [Peromyscus californicus insignis]
MQKGIRLNDGHVASLGLLARKDGTRKGYLSKRSSDNTKWQTKWFALLQNLLFYFESDSSSRPSGLYLLEGCVCDRAPSPKPGVSAKEPVEKQHYFTVNFTHENQKALELRTEDAKDCDEWVAAIAHASYRTLATEHEALMQKYLHLLQIVETEKTVAKQLRQQIEDGEIEIERLKAEIASLLKDNERIQSTQIVTPNDEDSDIKKIKKVQSFLRGWLCRRKWKTVIQDYIRSPHADSMRKRNQVVFSMLEAEAEYVQQLHILVNNFLRPLRMAASSKKPPITHDDVSSIFLNSETIMFLHQIFYQGLKARISSWPTLVLADLFDILLPMLNIYQEFVRNHQYSLQILAHCKQNRDFDKLLKQYEAKPDCEERTLETFLTYPMFQIPRYILTLHELLAHTPHEHVERNSLDYAKSKLEELSRIMHDEVSETENIRKNLAIERMIIEGCEILLDTSQTFVRQGSLIQVPMSEKGKITRGRLGSLSLKKEGERQCFLFSKHLIICTRGSGGKLHLTKNGVISLIDCTLMEEPENTEEEAKGTAQDIDHLDFKIGVEPKESPPFTVILVASSRQEKAAWTSDISQCVDNIRCNGLMMNAFEENSKVTVPQMIKSDASLYCDDVDIRFSKTMNSCKVLQIRYASVERLLERLTDLRFLSIDFLNTFLHSYRVFTTAVVVLDKLITIYKKPISAIPARSLELLFASGQNNKLLYGEPPKSPRATRKFSSPPPLSINTSSPSRRRKLSLNIPIITGGKALDLAAFSCSSNGFTSMHSPMSPFSKSTLDTSKLCVTSSFTKKTPDETDTTTTTTTMTTTTTTTTPTPTPTQTPTQTPTLTSNPASTPTWTPTQTPTQTPIRTPAQTPTQTPIRTPAQTPTQTPIRTPAQTPTQTPIRTPAQTPTQTPIRTPTQTPTQTPIRTPTQTPIRTPAQTPTQTPIRTPAQTPTQTPTRTPTPTWTPTQPLTPAPTPPQTPTQTPTPVLTPTATPEKPEEPSALSKQSSEVSVKEDSDADQNQSDDCDTEASPTKSPSTPASVKSKNSSEFPLFNYNNGVVMTSCRELDNTRSALSASSAFAIATAGANESTPKKEKFQYRRMSLATTGPASAILPSWSPILPPQSPLVLGQILLQAKNANRESPRHPLPQQRFHTKALPGFPPDQRNGDKEFVIRRAATNRVLNVLRHWVSKHSQDFETNSKLKSKVISFLEEVMHDPELLTQERKAAANIIRTLTQEDPGDNQITLEEIAQMAEGVKAEPFENHSALEIAEQLTLLDHLVFKKIPYEEFFGQGWMKVEKNERTPYIMKTTKHFNDISNLIASEIIRNEDINARVSAIEKWVAVADICRCLHNYNAVLEITSSMNRSAIFRLKKTWLKVSKQTKALIDKLQKLVSSEGRFKNLREALKNCDPPCVPYLGMYLTDLAFIEEGTPNYTEDGLVNFSKMRMISHIIREIRQFQQTAYKIEHQAKVTQYLLDRSFVMDEESLYESSLRIEPKLPT